MNNENHRIYTTPVSSVYPLYVKKVERKGRTKKELDEIIMWLTGYSELELSSVLSGGVDFKTFFNTAPHMNPRRENITGVICGVRVEEIDHPTMKAIRQLDKLVDELAKGKAMEKILR